MRMQTRNRDSWIVKTVNVAVAAGFALVSCGGSDAPGGIGAGGAGGSGGSGAGMGGLGGTTLGDASPPTDGGGGGGCGAPDDPNNCGTCGNVCPPDHGCVAGVCACPVYRKLCNGTCIPTTADPDNCGGCGTVCPPNQACSAGACSPTCLPGLTICSRACVDVKSDNSHCGGCGNACGAGKGCVGGSCIDVITVGQPPGKCAGGGPPIGGSGSSCLGNTAQTTFRWALCSCKDVNLDKSHLTTDAYDSSQGPYLPGGLGGGVGLNGSLGSSSANTISGALWASASGGVTSSAMNSVKQELHVGGPLSTSAPFSVGDDAYVAGNISTTSTIAIGKRLLLPDTSTITGNVTSASIVRQPVTVPPPCDCQPHQLVPVAAMVAARAGTSNDNGLINLPASALATPLGHAVRLDLPCGVYYLSSIDQGDDDVTIVAHGRTALFIGGDVLGGNVAFLLDPNAEFDVFVAGQLTTGQGFTVGSPNYPALSRTYFGSTAPLILTGQPRIGGNVYAAYGLVDDNTDTTIYGGLYAGDFTSSSNVDIHFDRAVLRAGEKCPPRPPTPDGGARDGGPGGCGSCRDCGNQACIDGVCGDCRTSADCCAPLVCGAGRCVVVPPK